MKKRLLSLFLAFAMVWSLLPAMVFADDSGMVYISASYDGQYLERLAHKPVSLSDLKAIDLDDYGLSEYLYDADDDGSYDVTALHLAVYAHTVLCEEDWSSVEVSGSPGSIFFASGLFGFADCNFNYYVNGQYPANEEGWGITADQYVLSDGDFIDIAAFTSWGFFGDSAAGFHYFMDDGEIVHDYQVVAGEALTVTLGRTFSAMGSETQLNTEANYTVFYGSALYEEDASSVTTDENGEAAITFPEDGTYYLWADGAYGNEDPSSIVSSPAYAKVTVGADQQPQDPEQPEEPEEPVASTAVTLSGLHDAQIYNFRLYTYTDGVKGETDLLDGVERIADGWSYKHEIALVPGDYWIEGVDANGDLNGGIAITVSEEAASFQIQRMYQIYATNSGWTAGTDYTIDVEVTDADGEIRHSTLGTADNYGTVYVSCLFVVGDEVKATFTPIGDRADFASAVSSKKKPSGNGYLSAKIPQVLQVTITAPADSTVSAGIFSDYYIYDFVEPTVTEDESGVTAVFRMPEITSAGTQSANHFYRVQNPEGVTYWNFAKWTTDASIEVTAEDLYIGDETFAKDTIINDYSLNVYDRADIYLNANHQGYLAMDVGDTHEWNVFRNWMAIESFYNAKVALPDVHYEVIELEGEDVLSIVPDENNSSVANMTATGEGTAIVLITYDAMTSAVGQGGTQFSAIWPENTGVAIVTVGEDGTNIDTNLLIDRVGAESTVMDAEHDILFYVGDEGAEFTFTPESGSTVTINRSIIKDGKMTFSDFTDEGVTTENGVVTLTGLTTGRHIVKVEKGGKANYQVITARGICYELQDVEGSKLAEDAQIHAGDTIKIQFNGLVNPVEKMSGAYNFNARIVLEGEDGSTYQSSTGGAYGVYDFSGNPARQNISITLPKYWDGETYTLNGNIAMSGNANVGLGGHRGFTYEYGFTFKEDSPSASLTVSRMPEITLHLAETTFVDGKLVFEDENGNSIDRADLTVTMTDDIQNTILVAEDGSFPCVAGDYNYVIYGAGYHYKTGSFTIGADDVGVTKKIILESASENAWDGVTKIKPAEDENDTYLIGTGAELAWFAAEQDACKVNLSGKLIADIDLAGYPWEMVASSSNYATVLDGDGYQIEDLNATVGLFSTLGSNSVIKDLTLNGQVNGTGNAGSIVKYASGSNVLIENCTNDASVTSTGSNVGGLVGYAYDGTTIKNCVNHGAVSGSSSVGGIIGSFSGASTVESCYNTGAITATGNCAGGIFGNTGSAATIKGCYNTGDISGVNFVGGVGGNLDGPWFGSGKATATDCYSIGTVTGIGANVGGVVGGLTAAKATLTRGYSLAGTAPDNSIGVVLSEAELKQASLDSTLYGGTCTGYPVLLWQNDVTFHTVGETATEIVASTCLEDGYSLYICGSCGQSTKKDIVAALGHSWCDEGEGAHSHSAEACEACEHCVYTAAVCKVNANCVLTCTREGCEVTKTKDLGGALEHEYCTHTTAEEACDHCVITAATCVENGSVIRNCIREGCDNEKTAEVIPFTGHTASGEADAEGLHTCSVCDRSYKVISALDTSEGEYAWVWNADKQRFESTNQGKGSTSSTGAKTITLEKDATVSFRYGVSSEQNYDKLTITAVMGEETVTIANHISGTVEGTFGQALDAGTYTLTAAFSKDYSGNSGEDLGWFSGVTITYAATSEPEQPDEPEQPTWQEILTKTKAYLIAQAETKAPTVGTTKGEWQVLGLARDGVSGSFYEDYFAAAKAYIAENADANGKLHAQKSTDNSRLILALTALGKDVTDVDGHNLLSGLSDLDYVKKQGINGPIFTLIALDSHDYVPAANATATREALISFILSKELPSGGWALSGQAPDDMTPMAVQALAPYYDTNAAVKAAVDKALAVMETMTATTETYAQIIVARSALGLDSADTMGKMLAYTLEDGSFEKAPGSGANQMSTEQAFYAMVAYSRYLAGENALYDMTDVTVQLEQPASAEAVKVAMEALEVEQSDKATYTAIQNALAAYGKLTREEKALIADTYEAFLDKEEDFEDLLKDAIDDAKLDLEDLYEELDSEDYTEDSWDEIRALYRDCRDAMKKAHYIEELEELLLLFEEDVENILVGAMEVTFRLIGDWRHEGGVSDHEEYVTWVKTTEYTLPAESTVYDLLLAALEEYDLSQKGASKNYVESIQAPDVLGGYWLGEFDNGPNSGWMYTINGDHPGTGLKDHDLEDGDEVIWHYVDDFTLEQRKPSSSYYDRWLEAEDITPETYIKRNLDNIVTVEGKGEVKPDLKTSHMGKDVKFTFTPAEGWVIKAVYVDGKNKGAVETFTYKDLAMDARIEVVFAQNTAFRMDFVDVPQSEWFYNDVYFAVSNGLFNGLDEDTFAPGASMTRGMLVTVLYRLEGQPAVYGGSPFADVAAGQWYTDAVIWASRKGIVNGLGNGKFGVDDNITREQMAAILYRYAQNCGYDTAARAYLGGYSDAAKISTYAQEAMAWANAMGLINGRTAIALAPDGTATRAEVAAIFHRFVENIAE